MNTACRWFAKCPCETQKSAVQFAHWWTLQPCEIRHEQPFCSILVLIPKPSQKSKFLLVSYLHKLYCLSPFKGHLKIRFHFEAACGSAFLHMTIYPSISHCAYFGLVVKQLAELTLVKQFWHVIFSLNCSFFYFCPNFPLMHCKQAWLLYISEQQLHSPTDLLSCLLSFCVLNPLLKHCITLTACLPWFFWIAMQ